MRIHALPEDVVTRAREAAGRDEHHERVAEAAGSPLRCCLRKAREGEPLVLFRYSPTAGRGPYEEVGPVFVHAEPCGGPDGGLPVELGRAPRVLRAYTAHGRIHDGVLAQPETLERDLADLLAHPEVVEVQVRSLSHGCFLFAVTGD
ncbi:DUF1203 domain-containing protein [Saccharothrix coeruleofusca]|nr:DUF1203 domain-containing protein [Saccharothrix coeruleofusca]